VGYLDTRGLYANGAPVDERATNGKKAAYVLEDARDRPSRKSTRRASKRQKPDSNLKRRQTRKTTSASARARRGQPFVTVSVREIQAWTSNRR
jgi:hypothetical protein